MKSDRKAHIASFVSLTVFCILAVGSMDSPAPTKTDTSSPTLPSQAVSAERLFLDYQRNEIAADSIYKGRTLAVTGTVSSINKDITDSAYLMLETSNEFMGVHANLRGSEVSKAAALSRGSTVTVVCMGSGMVIGSPILSDCIIQPNQPEQSPTVNQQTYVQSPNPSAATPEAPLESAPVPVENSKPSPAQPVVSQESTPVTVESSSLSTQPTSIAEIDQQATVFWNQKRYSDAFHLFNQACIGGNANSCYHLGLMYDFGQGLPQDSPRAAALYSRSCNSGNGAACYHLGMLRDYRPGNSVCNSPALIPNASRGCDSGDAMSCTMLGYSYSYGCGVAKDAEKGRQFLSKGCSLGYERACDGIK